MEMLLDRTGATGVITTGDTATGAGWAAATGAAVDSSAEADEGDLCVRNAHVLITSTMATPHNTTSR